MLAAGAVLLATATAAHAAPTVTANPSGPVVASIPTFTVTATPPATTISWTLTGPDGYEEFDFNASSPRTTDPFPLGPDGLYTFTATETPATTPTPVTFTLDTTPPPTPTITSGPPVITGPASQLAFAWSGDSGVGSSQWQLLDVGAVVAEGTSAATQVSFPSPTLAAGDRILRFRVRLVDSLGRLSPFSNEYVFNVDQTPPGAPTGLTGPTGITRDLAPVFSWQGAEFGGRFEWAVIDLAGRDVLGPVIDRTTTATDLAIPALPLAPSLFHPLIFKVRQVDEYGNRSSEAEYPFAINTNRPKSQDPTTRYAKFMTPKAGRVLTSLRPLLTWRRVVPGATLYNVKVYDGNRKVLSTFPRSNKFRVPKGKLKPGKRYTWYVWSYVEKKGRYAALPMKNWFETIPPAA